jgi:hypothetical protein
MMEKIKELWEKLPKTIKVAVYLSGAGLLNEIASALLGTKQLDLLTYIKVATANLLLVLVAEIKAFAERKK